MNILITGASGFIGRNLLEHLKRRRGRYQLFYPQHSELELQDTEAVRAYVRGHHINSIIHCANVGGSRKTSYDANRQDVVEKNLKMFFNLARTLDKKQRMIVMGSGAEYDRRHYRPKMKESDFGLHVPHDPYGFSKYVITSCAQQSHNILNLRFFGVFGKYEDYSFRFISNAIVKNILGLPIIINQNVFFDFLYIDDAVRIIEHFITARNKFSAYNVTSGKTIDLVTIAHKISALGKRPSRVIVNHPGLNTEYSGDNARLLGEIRHFRFTPFETAVRELYLWYHKQRDSFDKKAIANDVYLKHCFVKI